MNAEREIIKKLFESKDYDDVGLDLIDEKTYTVGDTQYWKRGGKCYKWTASGGRQECSDDEYIKAISGGNDKPVKDTLPTKDKAKDTPSGTGKSKGTSSETDKPSDDGEEPKELMASRSNIGSYIPTRHLSDRNTSKQLQDIVFGKQDHYKDEKTKDILVSACKSMLKAHKKSAKDSNYRDSLYSQKQIDSLVTADEYLLNQLENLPVKGNN